jgi:transposase
MAVGNREPDDQGEWVGTWELPRSPGHPFCQKLNQLLRASDFDRFCEKLCVPYYAERLGRPSLPPGVYFRMLLVGYFEGIDSQRGIAWRCSDSLALREFLRLRARQQTPDHSTLTVIRKRLPVEVHDQVFAKVLSIAQEKGLLKGGMVAVDSTTLEANAAMKSIVRKDSGEDWKEYVTHLAQEAGIENPADEELRRFDRKRQGKKASNDDWHSPSDPDARIAKMKNGDTHLGSAYAPLSAYKAEHAVDLETEMILSAPICPADRGDPDPPAETLIAAQQNLQEAGSEQIIEEAVADKGYHKADTLATCAEAEIRTCIPERKGRRRTWMDKPNGQQAAVYANRRRVKGARSKRLQRWRSERVERSFAHICETGGARRSWIRGLMEVTQRYLIRVAGHNLGILMRKLFGMGTPRSLQGSSGLLGSSSQLWEVLHFAFPGILSCLKPIHRPESCGQNSVAVIQVAA